MAYQQMVIPVGVARTVVSSDSFKDYPEDGTARASILRIFEVAARHGRGYRHKLSYSTADSLRTTAEIVDIVRSGELLSKADQMALDKFAEELAQRLVHQEQIDEEDAARQKKLHDEMAASNRLHRTKQRERVMSSLVENGRGATLREIAQDYGLNIKDPQIRAALIAAFHAGALRVGQAMHGAVIADEPQFTAEQLDKLEQQNKATFDKARQMAADQALARDGLPDQT